jgi:hypothetical protein
MAAMMEAEGVSPVAIYLMSDRISDLSLLATMEAAGFKPAATLIILNEGRTLMTPLINTLRHYTRSRFRVHWRSRRLVSSSI